MAERIKMNSESLQTSFPDVYKEFFSKCSIVTSAPYFFYWAGEYAMSFGCPAISQKVPLRVYVGLEKTDKKGIEFGDSLLFVPSKGIFQKFEHDYHDNQKLLHHLKELILKFDDHKKFTGYKIHTIFEIPRDAGLNATSAFLSALVGAIALISEKVSLDDYQKIKSLTVNELIGFDSFNLLFHEAWKLNTVIHHGMSSGSSLFSSLADSKYPIVYFGQKIIDKNPREHFGRAGENGDIDNLKCWAFDLGSFFNLDAAPVWTIDFGLIYSGSPKHSAQIGHTLTQMDEYLNQVVSFVNHGFNKSKREVVPPFVQKALKNNNLNEFRDNYVASLSFLTMDIMRSMKETFSKGSDDSLTNLFRSVNLYDNLIYSLNDNFNSVRYICNFIKEDPKNNSEGVGIATKVCGLGRGGDILFVSPYGSLRNYIYQVREDVVKNIGKDTFLDYLSWEDGYGEEGLLVEQFVDNGVYSKFISHDVVRISNLDGNGDLQSNIVSNDSFDAEVAKIDLLLHSVKGDVYIRGKVLNSKEIFSAKYTIEFLNLLLKSPNKEISNKDLPRSSYSTNRNEFQGKILIPIQKVIKKKIKRDLIIEISGTTDDFRLKLKVANCNICFLEKVF